MEMHIQAAIQSSAIYMEKGQLSLFFYLSLSHTYTHTHTHAHTHTHTHTQHPLQRTQLHAHTHTYTHTHKMHSRPQAWSPGPAGISVDPPPAAGAHSSSPCLT